MKRRRQSDPGAFRKYEHTKYERNGEKIRAKSRQWRVDNPDKARHQDRSTKAARRGASGSHTLAEWRDRCHQFDGRCAYCGSSDDITKDHMIPISRGGSDSIDNVVPACLSCNLKKSARTPLEFYLHLAEREAA